MKPRKKDLMIILHDDDRFRVYLRKRIFLVFHRWVEIADEAGEALEFKSRQESLDFIENISED